MPFNYSTITGGLYNLPRCCDLYSAVALKRIAHMHCNVIYFQTIYILSSNFMSVIFSQPSWPRSTRGQKGSLGLQVLVLGKVSFTSVLQDVRLRCLVSRFSCAAISHTQFTPATTTQLNCRVVSRRRRQCERTRRQSRDPVSNYDVIVLFQHHSLNS